MTARRSGGYILVMSSYRNALPTLSVDGQRCVEVRGSSTFEQSSTLLSFKLHRFTTFSRVSRVASVVMRHCYILVVLLLTQRRLATSAEVRSREVVHLLLRTSWPAGSLTPHHAESYTD